MFVCPQLAKGKKNTNTNTKVNFDENREREIQAQTRVVNLPLPCCRENTSRTNQQERTSLKKSENGNFFSL